jgi:CDP-diacylglycerol---glycerol-3-phosphate 3-phosphatidyltransferase
VETFDAPALMRIVWSYPQVSMTTVHSAGAVGPGTAASGGPKSAVTDDLVKGSGPLLDPSQQTNDASNFAVPKESVGRPMVSVWNVPNLLTTLRFFLAIGVVFLIDLDFYLAAMVTFLVAATTDWMDGYYARKYGQITKLGRIFDPFVDKIIICGAFIALVGIEKAALPAWMAIVVVARELLVTSLRGIIEGSGGDFSASWLGKWKMVFQCVAVVAVLLCLVMENPSEILEITRILSLWVATGLTVYSGVDYVIAAARVLGQSEGSVS